MNHPKRLDTFDHRAASYSTERINQYNLATQAFPGAREHERAPLIALLNARPGQHICDVTAGGGYLADGIYAHLGGDCHVYCVENSAHFCASLPDRYQRLQCSLSEIVLPDNSMDRVTCLAGLHHQQDKQAFFKEAFRLLRPGGKIAVADVMSGSAPAQFLNVEVDRWSDIGHDGMFFEPGELTQQLTIAGFINATEQVHKYTWDLPSYADLLWFCKALFQMANAEISDVGTSLERCFDIELGPGFARLPWSLVYACADK